jgi:hypothetical protein
VRGVLIRQLTFSEHVLARGLPRPAAGAVRAEAHAVRDGIPVLLGADGDALLAQARERGVRLG